MFTYHRIVSHKTNPTISQQPSLIFCYNCAVQVFTVIITILLWNSSCCFIAVRLLPALHCHHGLTAHPRLWAQAPPVTYQVTQHAQLRPFSWAVQRELWQHLGSCQQVAWAGKEARQVSGQGVWSDCCYPEELSIHHIFTRKFRRCLAGENKMWFRQHDYVPGKGAITSVLWLLRKHWEECLLLLGHIVKCYMLA